MRPVAAGLKRVMTKVAIQAKTKRTKCFEKHALACQLAGGLAFVVFSHNLKLDAVFEGIPSHVRLDRHQDAH